MSKNSSRIYAGFLGFTLIEVLIALTVFSILAGITSSAIYYAFDIKKRLNTESANLAAIQIAIAFLQRDSLQVIERPIRSHDGQLIPAFIGQSDYFEFTRGGVLNPQSIEKRSSLQRVAYLCRDNLLIRRSWNGLDLVNRNNYRDKILLTNIKKCHFAYLDRGLQILSSWQANVLAQNKSSELFPKAIQSNFIMQNMGSMSFLFKISEAIYAG